MITLEKIKARLELLGYTATESDDGMLTYIMNMVQRSVLRVLNVLEITEEMENIVIDKICGEFLLNLKASGQNVQIVYAQAVKSIQEGDTTVAYDPGMSEEAQLDSLIRWLISGRDSVLISYRCIRW